MLTFDPQIQNKRAKLIDLSKTFDISTIQHAYEIQNDRRADMYFSERPWLHGLITHTADFSLYTMEKDEAILYFADREHNLILQNVDDAIKQIQRPHDNYFPQDSDIEAVITAPTTLKIRLSDLKLSERVVDECNITFSVTGYDTLNETKRNLVERIYGTGQDFIDNMAMMVRLGCERTRIQLLHPDYVKETLEKTGAKSLSRGSILWRSQRLCSTFMTTNWNITEDIFYWRGKLLPGQTGYYTPSILKS
jgi:hypothetical protein